MTAETHFAHIRQCADESTWLELRKQRITSSDAPVIAGVGFIDLYTLWAIKTGKIPPQGDRLRFRVGRALENVLEKELEDRRGLDLYDPGDYAVAENEWRLATPDRLILRGKEIAGVAEFKTVVSYARDTWEAGPPPYTWIQLQHQLSTLGVDWGIAAALVGMTDWVDYDVALDSLTEEALLEAEERFFRLVMSDIPPPVGGLSSKAALAQMFPSSQDTVVSVDYSPAWEKRLERRRALLEDQAVKKAELEAVQSEIAVIENQIKEIMGEAERVEIGDTAAFTWKTIHRKGYEVSPSSTRRFKEVK